MPLILFWAEVEKEDNDENSVFPGMMNMEEDESSLFSLLMKMESDEEK